MHIFRSNTKSSDTPVGFVRSNSLVKPQFTNMRKHTELADLFANSVVRDSISNRIYETTERSTPIMDSYLVQTVTRNLQLIITCWFMPTHIQAKFTSCKKCNHSTNTRYNLRQHIHGQHGPGWTAKCGEHFKWAPKMH